MKIGIDARVLDRPITGTGRYLLNILKELPNHDTNNEYFVFSNSELQIDKSFYTIISHKPTALPVKLFSPIWLNSTLPRLLTENKVDLLFEPNVILPLVNLGNVKCISVVHDVIFKIYKEYYPFIYRQYLSLLLPPSLIKSDAVITVSDLSKNDIIKYYQIAERKIHVSHNTALEHFKPRNYECLDSFKTLQKYSLPSKYLLYVGAIERRKNILGLIKILDLLGDKRSDLKLVMVGKTGYDADSIMPEILKRKNSIRYFDFVDDEALPYIYNSAFAFIFPSFYEGFGIPPLEAMQSGVPVLSSNTPALLEVVGEGGLLRNPNDYMGFVNDILALENDSALYSMMKLKALDQSKKFNIKTTTKLIVDVFDYVLNKNLG
jgi:glycosyltransferase involved in cell wall biosynthesis